MCDGHNHCLVDIYAHGDYDGPINVVRWCCDCGAIVVDVEIDGRVRPGGKMKMRFPKDTA